MHSVWHTADLLATQCCCMVHLQVFYMFDLFRLSPCLAHRMLGEESSMNKSHEHGDHSTDNQQRTLRCNVTARVHS